MEHSNFCGTCKEYLAAIKPFLCADCKANTMNDEYYMVTDKIWQEAKAPERSMLCIGCLEKRLGRELVKTDFVNSAVNQLAPESYSPRLRNRLGL